jgi:putative flippase GtrA
VGFSNSLVSLAVLNLFYFFWAPTWSLPLVLGSSVAYAAGDINSFWWNGRWTFAAGKPNWVRFSRFALLSLAFLTLNALVVWGSSGWLLGLMLPVWLLNNIPQIIMALTGSAGYLACRLWVFK